MKSSSSGQIPDLDEENPLRKSLKSVEANRVASEDKQHYILMKKASKKGANVLFDVNLEVDQIDIYRETKRKDHFQRLEREPARFKEAFIDQSINLTFISDSSEDSHFDSDNDSFEKTSTVADDTTSSSFSEVDSGSIGNQVQRTDIECTESRLFHEENVTGETTGVANVLKDNSLLSEAGQRQDELEDYEIENASKKQRTSSYSMPLSTESGVAGLVDHVKQTKNVTMLLPESKGDSQRQEDLEEYGIENASQKQRTASELTSLDTESVGTGLISHAKSLSDSENSAEQMLKVISKPNTDDQNIDSSDACTLNKKVELPLEVLDAYTKGDSSSVTDTEHTCPMESRVPVGDNEMLTDVCAPVVNMQVNDLETVDSSYHTHAAPVEDFMEGEHLLDTGNFRKKLFLSNPCLSEESIVLAE